MSTTFHLVEMPLVLRCIKFENDQFMVVQF